jgi:hypothetical protein
MVMVYNAILTIFQLYREGCFIGGGNRSTRSEQPTCASYRETLSHNVVSTTLCRERVINGCE